MSDTRDKLVEAAFFLERLKEQTQFRLPFRHYLSAFLSAARSVTFLMQKEFATVPGFEEWYTREQEEMRGDPLMKFMNEKRVMTVHTEPLRPYVQTRIPVGDQVALIDHIALEVTRSDGTVERAEPDSPAEPFLKPQAGKPPVEWRWFFEDLPDDVVTACTRYLERLQGLVQEAESKFGRPAR